MKKDEFVDLMRQQGWTAEEVKEMVEVPMCGCVRAGVPDEYGDTPPRDGIDPDGVRIGQMLAGRRPGRQHARLRPPRGRPPAGEDAGRGALGRDRRGPLRRRPYRQDLLRGRGRVEVAHAGQRQLPGHAHRRDARVSHLWRGADDHPRAPAGRPCDLYQGGEEGQAERTNTGLGAGHRLRAEPDPRAYPVQAPLVCRLCRAARPAGRRRPRRVYRPSVRDHGRGGSRSRRQGPGETQRVELQKARLPMGRERLSCWQWTLSGVSGDSPSLPQEAICVGKGRG